MDTTPMIYLQFYENPSFRGNRSDVTHYGAG